MANLVISSIKNKKYPFSTYLFHFPISQKKTNPFILIPSTFPPHFSSAFPPHFLPTNNFSTFPPNKQSSCSSSPPPLVPHHHLFSYTSFPTSLVFYVHLPPSVVLYLHHLIYTSPCTSHEFTYIFTHTSQLLP